MRYKALRNTLVDADDNDRQILVMLLANCSMKRAIEICKITANVLNNIERGQQGAA